MLNEETRFKEYLQREKLTHTTFYYKERHCYVETLHNYDSSRWFDCSYLPILDKKELLTMYKEITAELKSQDCKIKRELKVYSTLTKEWDNYLAHHEMIERMFREMVKDLKKIEKRGLRSGVSDDLELKALNEKKWKFEDMLRHPNNRKMYEAARYLHDLHNRLFTYNHIYNVVTL